MALQRSRYRPAHGRVWMHGEHNGDARVLLRKAPYGSECFKHRGTERLAPMHGQEYPHGAHRPESAHIWQRHAAGHILQSVNDRIPRDKDSLARHAFPQEVRTGVLRRGEMKVRCLAQKNPHDLLGERGLAIVRP